MFAGFFFSAPQGDIHCQWRDDSERDELYPFILSQIRERPEALADDSRLIRDWILSGDSHLHSFIVTRSKYGGPEK